MRCTLLLTCSFQEMDRLTSIKSEIISYLGERMILDKMEGSPAMILNSELEAEDTTYVANLIQATNSQTITCLIIKHETGSVLNSYTTTLILPE